MHVHNAMCQRSVMQAVAVLTSSDGGDASRVFKSVYPIVPFTDKKKANSATPTNTTRTETTTLIKMFLEILLHKSNYIHPGPFTIVLNF